VGLIAYSPPVPALGLGTVAQPCATVSWSNGLGSAAGGALNSASNAFAGLVTVALSGTGCETLMGGSGTVSVTLTGSEPLGLLSSTLQCNFNAGYLRLGTLLQIDGPGSCVIDGWATGVVYISARLTLTPANPGLGVIGSMSSAAVAGVWEINPGHS
jgi:hypothetical protein